MEDHSSNYNSAQKSLYIDRLRQLYSSTIDINDDMKMLDLKEIEQEEYYIAKLREQRERMELLKHEFEKKNTYIKQLEFEIDKNKEQIGNLRTVNQLYQKVAQEKEIIEVDLKKYKTQNIILQGELEKTKDLLALREEQLNQFREETESLSLVKQNQEDQIIELKTLLADQLRDQERKYKSETETLKDDKYKLQLEVGQLKEQILDFQRNLDQFQHLIISHKQLEDNLHEEKDRRQKAERKMQEIHMNSQGALKQGEEKIQQVFQEYNDLQMEVERQSALIKNQEQIISEFRRQRRDDENRNKKIIEDLAAMENERGKNLDVKKELVGEYHTVVAKLKQRDTELLKLRKENAELRAQLASYIMREENEQKIKHELDRVKHDLNNEKSAEVDKISRLFEEFSSLQKPQHRLSEDLPRQFKSASPDKPYIDTLKY